MKPTPAALAKLAYAATATRPAVFTLAAAGGRVYAAWPYGCVQLPAELVEVLDNPDPGTYTINSKGDLSPADGRPALSPGVAEQQMLPLLDAQPRTPVEASGWLHEHGVLTRRYLSRDGIREPLAVHAPLWTAWTSAADGDPYAIPRRSHHAIAWAPTPDARATALLFTIHPRAVPTPPDWTPEGT